MEAASHRIGLGGLPDPRFLLQGWFYPGQILTDSRLISPWGIYMPQDGRHNPIWTFAAFMPIQYLVPLSLRLSTGCG
jgi:hypothetical protein